MLDDVLGKTELKERIKELEEELNGLEDRLESEERKRKTEAREKQEAYERANKMESKVQELEDRLERAGEDEEDASFRVARTVRGTTLSNSLDFLESARSGEDGLTTMHVASGDRVPDEFETETTAALQRVESKTGFVAFGDDAGLLRVALVPPLAVEETRVEHGPRFALDRSLFELPEPHAVAVIRSDEYAGGVYSGGERLAFSSRSSEVKSQHSKGGYSQGRFERARDEEVKKHVRESADEFDATLAGHDVKHVFVAGESRVASDFADEITTRVPVLKRTTDATGSGEEFLRQGYATVESARLYVV
ncbi:MAG: Vms1/Ankzf1 family peptidyl-tRNA hydrolase [Halobacteriales archaeon]|nr:Vms1/Ankzf1 family peptidyl-tRNA hydrolase [Halobacteriales archaeon]